MKCISYGYFILFSILIIAIGSAVGYITSPEIGMVIGGVGTLFLFGWFIAGFFAKCCTPYLNWFAVPPC
jgi:hypothetical protein